MQNRFDPALAKPSLSRHTAGSPVPVYVGGFLYRSIFEASVESGISSVWMLNRLKASRGAPVFIRGTAVVEQDWVVRIAAPFIPGRIRALRSGKEAAV